MSSKLDQRNILMLKIMMCSAFLIITARVIAPFEVGKDQALQIEAAERLATGLGLTTTYFVTNPNDVSQPPEAHALTWWPPGFSLIVAGLLLTNLPLAISLKLVYAGVTLAGWIGWSIIASYLLTPLSYRGRTYHLNYLIGAALPILFTPLWSGTDIFLWAGAPLVLLCLFRGADVDGPLSFVAFGGLLFGMLYAVRYSSMFLGLAAVLIIFQKSFPLLKPLIIRLAIFGLSSSVAILPTYFYVKFFSQKTHVLPEVISVGTLPRFSMRLITAILFHTPVVTNVIFGIPQVETLIFAVRSRFLAMLVGSICVCVLLLVPIILAKRSQRTRSDNLAISLSLLPVALIILLLVVTFVAGINFFREQRYYIPVSLCGILIFYHLFVSRGSKIIRAAAGSVVLCSLLYICCFVPLKIALPTQRAELVQLTLGFSLPKQTKNSSTSFEVTYPEIGLYSLKENSRRKLTELKRENPQAIFFADNYTYYAYDDLLPGGPERGKDLRRFPPNRQGFWSNAYTSKPIRVFWVMDNPDDLKFVSQTNLNLIYFDPYEKTKIFLSEFPAGTSFSAKPVAN